MSLIIGLLILAFLLFSFEILVPGGILGVLGAIAVIAACVMTYMDFGTLPATTLFIVALIVIGLMIALEFWLIANTSIGERVLLRNNTANKISTDSSKAEESLIGKEATALTPLTPTGLVEIEGKQYEGLSRDGSVAKGESLKVVSRDSFRVLVEKSS